MASSNFVDTPGLRIHYRQEGVGEPVLLLHGFPQTSHQWRYQMSALAAAGYACFAPDNRGFGQTDKTRIRITRSLLARDVARFLDAVGIDAVHLVTHDWGGIIGFKFLADFPDRVKTITLLDTLCTVWPTRGQHGYWFKAEDLAEAFFAEHHRNFIDVTFAGLDGATLPGAPVSPWSFGGGTRPPLRGVDDEALAHYRAAFADPDSHFAAIQYYRYGLPFHRIDAAGRAELLSEREVADMWLHPGGLKAHPDAGEYFDYGPEDRWVRASQPALWMYSTGKGDGTGERVEAPQSNPFVSQFSRHFSHLEAHAVRAGHFLPEEASGYVTTELLRFLGSAA